MATAVNFLIPKVRGSTPLILKLVMDIVLAHFSPSLILTIISIIFVTLPTFYVNYNP
jgi:hypothetical protein